MKLEALVSKGWHAVQKVMNVLIFLNCDTLIAVVKRANNEELAKFLYIGV
ncbi:MAG: hypothetical protein ACTXOO_03340 [Sodalis sp. (in: enterobacteria)]